MGIRLHDAGLFVVAVATASLCVYALNPAPSGGTSAYVVPEASASASPSPETTRAVFVGDSFTNGSGTEAGDAEGLGMQIARELGWTATVSAGSSSGYVATDAQGVAFGDRLPAVVAARPDVVVISGSGNDIWHPVKATRTASRNFYRAINSALPKTKIVVIGVMWGQPVDTGAPATPDEVNDALRDSAKASGAQFIDPLDPNWMADMSGRLSPDGVHPNAAGYRHLAEQAAPRIERALD